MEAINIQLQCTFLFLFIFTVASQASDTHMRRPKIVLFFYSSNYQKIDMNQPILLIFVSFANLKQCASGVWFPWDTLTGPKNMAKRTTPSGLSPSQPTFKMGVRTTAHWYLQMHQSIHFVTFKDKLAPSCQQAGQGPLDKMVHYDPTKGEGKNCKGCHTTRSCTES
jgi:hypothetical protein